MKDILLKAEKGVMSGEKLSSVLEKCGQFPARLCKC